MLAKTVSETIVGDRMDVDGPKNGGCCFGVNGKRLDAIVGGCCVWFCTSGTIGIQDWGVGSLDVVVFAGRWSSAAGGAVGGWMCACF